MTLLVMANFHLDGKHRSVCDLHIWLIWIH